MRYEVLNIVKIIFLHVFLKTENHKKDKKLPKPINDCRMENKGEIELSRRGVAGKSVIRKRR